MTEIKPRTISNLFTFSCAFYPKWGRDQMLRGKYQSIKTLHHVDFRACKNMFLHLSVKSAVLRHAELKLDFKKVLTGR